jgi:hypothetical protein
VCVHACMYVCVCVYACMYVLYKKKFETNKSVPPYKICKMYCNIMLQMKIKLSIFQLNSISSRKLQNSILNWETDM